MQDCIFCKIAAGEIPAKVIYEDENVIAFHDIKPVAPVHVLIVPKRHVSDVISLASDDERAALMQAVLQAVPIVAEKMGVADKGFRLINNCGTEGGQTVMHLHFHMIGGRDLGEKLL
ncbi:MAG: histidine triad family protein [Clostridiales bacterium]|jgi:histidine triad (HIT) family protein|nr:histidine triad family protein [Clostridiales bacterium]